MSKGTLLATMRCAINATGSSSPMIGIRLDLAAYSNCLKASLVNDGSPLGPISGYTGTADVGSKGSCIQPLVSVTVIAPEGTVTPDVMPLLISRSYWVTLPSGTS